MGIKSEKKRLTSVLGTDSGKLEFTENLFDNFAENRLSEASKESIKNVLAKKYKEFDVLNTEPVRFATHNLHRFAKFITFDKKYQDCVIEIQNNIKQVNIANLFASIRNSDNNRRKK